MNWQVVSRPEAENDVIEIAAWSVQGDLRGERAGENCCIAAVLHAARHDRK
jgi:hypothetical protein